MSQHGQIHHPPIGKLHTSHCHLSLLTGMGTWWNTNLSCGNKTLMGRLLCTMCIMPYVNILSRDRDLPMYISTEKKEV